MSDRSEGGPSKSSTCAVCGKKVSAKFAPFCSRRCADLDLGRWLKGGYVIPARPDDAEDGAETPKSETPPEDE